MLDPEGPWGSQFVDSRDDFEAGTVSPPHSSSGFDRIGMLKAGAFAMCCRRIIFTGFVMLLWIQPVARADSILLDDFSTNLTLPNVQFFALNADGSINPTGSTAGSMTSSFWKRVQLAPGNMARWNDGSIASPAAGVLGGVRSVEIRNGTSSNQTSNFKIFTGVMEVDSPSANMLCLSCLTYDFGSSPKDFSIVEAILLDFTSFDASAQSHVRLSVSLSDGVTTASGLIDTRTAVVGMNKFYLMGMNKFSLLNMSSIRSVRLDFTTTNPGVDFKLNSVAFTHAPEPSTFGALALVLGIPVGVRAMRLRRKRNCRDIESSAGDFIAAN